MKTIVATVCTVLLTEIAAAVGAESVAEASSGSLRIPSGVRVGLVDQRDHQVTLTGRDEPVLLPADLYTVVHWSIERADEQGHLWCLKPAAHSLNQQLHIAAGQDTALVLGEPMHLSIYQRKDGRRYSFTCDLRGHGAGQVAVSKGRGGAIPPQLLIANADLSYQQTMNFRFG